MTEPRKTMRRLEIVRALVANGGSVENAQGRALAELARLTGSPPQAEMVRVMEVEGLIRRQMDKGGKRCLRIELGDLPASWSAELSNGNGHNGSSVSGSADTAQVSADPDTASEEPAVALDPDVVADAILRRVAEILSMPALATEVKVRLSSALEMNERLRRKLDLAGDELHAVKSERDGLRSRLRDLQANYDAVLKDKGRAIDAAVRRQIKTFMEERPHVGAGVPD